MKNSTKRILSLLLIIIGIVLIASLFSSNNAKELNYAGSDSLISDITNGKVSHLQITGDYLIKVRYSNSSFDAKLFPNKYDAFAYIPNRDATELFKALDDLNSKGAAAPALTYDNPGKRAMLYSLLLPIFSVVLLGVLFFVIYRQNQGQNNKALNFGKTKARVVKTVNVRFKDVAGAEEEKEELQEIVEFLKNPKKFIEIGARIPKGVLLVGPPGTGKTLFAKAVAGEANVPFFSISGSDFVEMFVGVGASRVRDLFEQAKQNMPCIIFIDEIDAVGRQRGTGLGGGHDEREQTLNQLLVQMDGFEVNDGVIVMAATNRADILDPALLRPGRFDRQVYVHIPDVKGREEIFKVHSRNKPLASDVDFKKLARLTSGFTGADIENLLNESAILAARANRKTITMADINEGINKVIAGPQKKSRVVTDKDKKITAYHESGHAIVAKLLENCDAVNEVSIIPRGMAAGYTITRPESDDNHITKNKLMDMITMLLAGRVSEEIVLHDISTGASNDIQRASSIARKMVTEWGMSTLGTIYLGSNEHEVFLGRDFAQQAVSSEMASKVDNEIKKILDECYKNARTIITKNRTILDNMVELLYEKETIFQDEVDMLFEGKTPSEIIAITNEIAMEKLNGNNAENTEVSQNITAEIKHNGDNTANSSGGLNSANIDSQATKVDNLGSENPEENNPDKDNE